jgi:hypothetical protein
LLTHTTGDQQGDHQTGARDHRGDDDTLKTLLPPALKIGSLQTGGNLKRIGSAHKRMLQQGDSKTNASRF